MRGLSDKQVLDGQGKERDVGEHGTCKGPGTARRWIFFFFKTPKSSSAEAKRNGLVEAAEKFQIQVTLLRKQLGVRES